MHVGKGFEEARALEFLAVGGQFVDSRVIMLLEFVVAGVGLAGAVAECGLWVCEGGRGSVGSTTAFRNRRKGGGIRSCRLCASTLFRASKAVFS